jgi:hypothetical protein
VVWPSWVLPALAAVNSCSLSVVSPVAGLVPAGKPAGAQYSEVSAATPPLPGAATSSEPGPPRPGTTACSCLAAARLRPRSCTARRNAAPCTATQPSGTAMRRPSAAVPTILSPAGGELTAVITGVLTVAYMACSASVELVPLPDEQPATVTAAAAAIAGSRNTPGTRLIRDPPLPSAVTSRKRY